MRRRRFFEYSLSPNTCRKTLSSPPRVIQPQLAIWRRSSRTCLETVFEVVQECAIRAICLTDAQPLPAPGANENEDKGESGANEQTQDRDSPVEPGSEGSTAEWWRREFKPKIYCWLCSCTPLLTCPCPGMAWSHLGAMDKPAMQLLYSVGARATLPSPPVWVVCHRPGNRHG